MTLTEYIAHRKKELEEFEANWLAQRQSDGDANNWPLEMDESEWNEQELSHSFELPL